MKKNILFSFFLLMSISFTYAQELPDLSHVKLIKKNHYKETEPLVIKVTNYLFSTPVDDKNNARREAGQFLMKWMSGTPYHTFFLEEKQTHYFDTDADLMLIYMAGLTKFTLENKAVKNQKEKVMNTMQLVLPYLDKQVNKKNWSNDLWQLMDSYQNGRLAEFLNQ